MNIKDTGTILSTIPSIYILNKCVPTRKCSMNSVLSPYSKDLVIDISILFPLYFYLYIIYIVRNLEYMWRLQKVVMLVVY